MYKIVSDKRGTRKNFENVHNLTPIEEESESTLCFKETSSNYSKQEGSSYRMKSLYTSYQRILRKSEEAEASGDNDEAEIGLRDKSLKTTVEQLKCRLSQVEREIVALKRYQSPQKCQSHERCEILRRDLLTWRDEHEKRISSQMVSWQLAESRRIHDKMRYMKKVYVNIERHLKTMKKQSVKFSFNFQRQIDSLYAKKCTTFVFFYKRINVDESYATV
ncbi:hypothetical protein PUN28_002695 [Cardiocondyla obscurior]|uniref:Uncharacterized protein n=1 Tax=Cardiocondyla obscurior TaxID=286306 RepID=A0AAW2GVX5_9HYME